MKFKKIQIKLEGLILKVKDYVLFFNKSVTKILQNSY